MNASSDLIQPLLIVTLFCITIGGGVFGWILKGDLQACTPCFPSYLHVSRHHHHHETTRTLSLLTCSAGASGNAVAGEVPVGPPTSEVVGASGRMGSLFLRQPHAVAVPRGVAPGCLSEAGRPIFVATPSQPWREIYRETLPERRDDLVWVGNGMPLEYFQNATVAIPHYGILRAGDGPVTSSRSRSPPTHVYGKHAEKVQALLEREGVRTARVTSWEDVRVSAARKLLWASTMWLLCHSSSPPLTVSSVHQEKQGLLVELVTELLPALRALTKGSRATANLEDTLAYLEAYSQSMPDAVPSKDLAMNEIKERNGMWLSMADEFPQMLHEELVANVAGAKVLKRTKESAMPVVNRRRERVEIADIGLTVWGERTEHCPSCRAAIVIGGGIIGSSIALNLARRGVNVTVVDCLSDDEVGATTPASWAWINANQKSPPAYKWLNQLGMLGWRKDAAFRPFPSWNGGLVQYEAAPADPGGYAVEGPLTMARLNELEPQANFSLSAGPVYFFTEEGCIDPSLAVQSLRQTARNLGVTFIGGRNVTGLVRNEDGKVVGIVSRPSVHSDENDHNLTLSGDVVVVAAGTGSASAALGGLPLLHSPGQIAFARPPPSGPSSSCHLTRVLVDSVRQSHVLMRRDGTLVAGGGYLQVGGSTSSPAAASELSSTTSLRYEGTQILEMARQLAPDPVGSATFTHSAKAVRPMPKDGLPALGYLGPGLYTAVTHSGVTLAPIVGASVAIELTRGVSLDLLLPHRPGRLFGS